MTFTHFQTLIHLINSEKEIISLNSGTFLYRRGEEGLCMYLVKSGAVKIFACDGLVEIGREGTIVGEESLLSARPRMANVIAITDCTVIPIDHMQLESLIKLIPDLSLVIQGVSDRRKEIHHGVHQSLA
ncbi:MAG TPA: cyclic nucleotide-binding domain-containing protein [Methylophilaceae bacterium]|jgi:CRP-like cAMP-binding protein|nr:cyclic nucleotide-binding domain-containing protein [Methylophilaceae bacterium]